MPSETPLSDPYLLTGWNISLAVPAAVPGAFVIYRAPEVGAMTPLFVGRSDSDLAAAIRGQMAAYQGPHYFAFCAAISAETAFEWECEIFHRLAPAETPSHPQRPSDLDWRCPVCGIEAFSNP